MKNPTVTVYQNESNVIIIFSPLPEKKDEWRYRGSSTSFQNHWMDGGACGIGGFYNKKELDKFLKKNKYIKKGTLKLSKYCYSNHTIPNGATLTCNKKSGHSGKCEADYKISFGDNRHDGKYRWIKK